MTQTTVRPRGGWQQEEIDVLFSAVKSRIGGEHALELLDGRADHAAVVPRRGA